MQLGMIGLGRMGANMVRRLIKKGHNSGKVERGVAVCGSGVGATVCANKVPGARACLIADHFSARQGVEDDHMNIICLGGRITGPMLAWDLVDAFLAAEFSQAERHLRRLGKVAALETKTTTPVGGEAAAISTWALCGN